MIKRYSGYIQGMSAAICMLLLILDTRTAIAGAGEGIELCIKSVIPALLPFFPLSILLTSSLCGNRIRIITPFVKALGMPEGSESILISGFLGGYPVGAQCIRQCYDAQQLSREDAHRLLGFCSNAGPGFIFGMSAFLFSNPLCSWLLWGIHIVSALLSGLFIPGKSHKKCAPQRQRITLTMAVQQSIKTTASVCIWIVLFRIITAFCEKWLLRACPQSFRTLSAGILELASGFAALRNIPQESERFILATLFLGMGGLCVGMQTMTVTGPLGTGWYFPGKFMQSFIGIPLSILACYFLFPSEQCSSQGFYVWGTVLGIITLVLFLIRRKIAVAFSGKVMYNNRKRCRRSKEHAVS